MEKVFSYRMHTEIYAEERKKTDFFANTEINIG
jgi:hypothetical protein